MKFRFTVIALLLTMLTGVLWAQSDRASIRGAVTDPSGAVVPEVEVTAINEGTNVQTTVKTNNEGLYSILNLPIGQYRMTFSKSGFKAFERKGISLQVAEIAQINTTLQVGANSESVTVFEDASVLQTETSAIDTSMRNTQITDLPLNVQGGRNLSNFAFAFVPGVEGTDYESHIQGSVAFTKEVMIDGTSAVSQLGGYISESSPSMEAVEEFQVQTSGVRADEGRSGGGVMRYNMKSGTNEWHGSAFGFGHNEVLNADSYTNKFNRQQAVAKAIADGNPTAASFLSGALAKPKDRMWDYGGSFGGPIVKDKTFFFTAYERYTFENFGLGQLNATVPSVKALNGDFTEFVDTTQPRGFDHAGNPVYQGSIIDPTTGNVFSCNGVLNVICPNRFSAVSSKIVDIYKQYYTPLTSQLFNNNARTANGKPKYTSNQFSAKVDHNFSEKNRLASSWIMTYNPQVLADQNTDIFAPGTKDGGPLGNTYNHNVKTNAIRLSDSHAFTPTLLNVAAITFNRFHNPSQSTQAGKGWPEALGLGTFGVDSFPRVLFNGINGDHPTSSPQGNVNFTQLGSQFNDYYDANTFVYSDNLSWVRGRHTFKFGAEFRAQQMNSHEDWGIPTFIFDPAQTAGYGTTGNAFASFLIGQALAGNVSTQDAVYGRRKTFSAYVQDDWKVNNRLTLNLDLRWDFNGKYHEKYGHWANFNPELRNPETGLMGAVEYLSDGSESFERNQYWLNFAPHVGAAYQINDKTVVRGSFSVFFVPPNLNSWRAIPFAAVFHPGYKDINTYNPGGAAAQVYNWDNGYPGTAAPSPKDPSYTGWGMTSIDPRALMPGNTQQFSLSVQRELAKDMRLDVNMMMNHSYHLGGNYYKANQKTGAEYTADMNSISPWSWVADPASAAAAGVTYPYAGFSGFAWMAVTPYPQVAATWGPLITVGSPDGNANYRAIQFSLSKRSGGLNMQVSYNLSESHGNANTSFLENWASLSGPIQDPTDLEASRNTISSFDVTHVVKGYLTYELPFGKGKQFMSAADGFLNGLVGGWSVSTAFHYNSGIPLQVKRSGSYPGWANAYANIKSGCDISGNFGGKLGDQYFNPTCFSDPTGYQLGNAPMYLADLRGFGRATEDMGITKYFTFADGRYRLNFRAEFFNVFNRHGYGEPVTDLSSKDFGKAVYAGGIGGRQGQFGARFVF